MTEDEHTINVGRAALGLPPLQPAPAVSEITKQVAGDMSEEDQRKIDAAWERHKAAAPDNVTDEMIEAFNTGDCVPATKSTATPSKKRPSTT